MVGITMQKRRSIRIVAALVAALATSAITSSCDVAHPVRPRVLFVGDSYTGGAGVEDSQDAYPELIAQKAKWDLHLDAQGATGFIEDGRGVADNFDSSRLIDRLAADKQNFPKVDLLVVDAGRDDLTEQTLSKPVLAYHPADEVANAILEYLTQARRQWPDAKIVEIFPAFVSTSKPYDGYPELLAKVSAGLSAVGGTLVDPIAEGWYANIETASIMDPDGLHPNRRGHAYIAVRLMESLRQSGVIPVA
jgi:lysophospholipase L1-like esterase